MTVAGIALLRATPAFADGRPAVRSRLAYSAPPACPGEDRFRALLAPQSDVALDPTAPILLAVEIHEEERRHRGRVAVVADEEEGAREMVAERCEDVVRGLAIFAAIALDAYLERHASEGPAPSMATPAARPEATTTSSIRRRLQRPARSKPLPARRPPTAQIRIGMGVGEQTTVDARPLYSVDILGALEIPRLAHASVRLSAHAGAVAPQSYRNGTLSFGMGWMRLELCPSRAPVGRDLVASLCAAGDMGLQRAALEGTKSGRSEVRTFTAVGAVGHLLTKIGRTVELEASLGAVAPLRPFDFLTRDGVVYSTPSVSPVIGLGLVWSPF